MPATHSQHSIALVTGASRGIGYALAKELASHRHDLVLTARDAAALDSLAEAIRDEFQVRVWVLPSDLSQRSAPPDLFEQCQLANLEIEILVNNAAFGIYGPFLDTESAQDLELLEVNLVAVTQLTKLFVQPMLARGHGRIVNVASTGAFRPGPFMATYYASKAYLASWSLALATELAGSGITVTTLCPGPTESSFGQRSGMQRSRISQNSAFSMTADEVARLAYRGWMRGRPLVIPGLKNKIQANAARFLPRRLVARLVHTMLQPHDDRPRA